MKIWTLLFFINLTSIYAFLPVAKITNIKGKPSLNKEVPVLGAEVSEGGLLSLKRGDQVTVEFQNGHQIKFGPGEYIVSVLNPKELLLEVSIGTVKVEVKKLTPNEKITIKSLMTTIQSSEGLWVLNNNRKQQRITVKEGELQIQRLKEAMILTKNEEAVIDLKVKFEKKKISERIVSGAMNSLK